jgi:hypothetical protein
LRSRLEVIQEELQVNPHDDAFRVVVEHVVEVLREFEEKELSDIKRMSKE